MKRLRNRLYVGLVVAVSMMGTVSRAIADEPVQRFLDELKQRRMYDIAVDYLDRMKDSPLAPAGFSERVPYEKAAVLIEGAKAIRDPLVRERRLDEAEKYLNQFINGHPNHALFSVAKNELANLLFQRAYVNIEKSRSPKLGAMQKDGLLNQARQQFAEAGKIFTATREDLKAKLQRIKPNVTDPELLAIRDKYRAEYTQARLLLPAVLEEQAGTYPEEAELRKSLLRKAAADYQKVYEDYRNLRGGLYARMYQGRCHYKLKEYDKAISYLVDLLDQSNEQEAIRILKKKTLTLAQQCWLKIDPPQHAVAIQHAGPIVDALQPDQLRDPEWNQIQLDLARIYRGAAEQLRSTNPRSNEDRRRIGDYTRKSLKLVRQLARGTGPSKREAQQLLAEWGSGPEPVQPAEKDPTTFAEARDRAKRLLDQFESARVIADSVGERLASVEDEQQKQELMAQLDDADKIILEAPPQALKYFRKAIDLTNEETSDEDICVVRYYMAYLFFLSEDYYNTAVIGEYQLARYPGQRSTQQCVDLALGAYWKLYLENQEADHAFEVARLKDLSDRAIQRWSGDPAALKAATLMVHLSLKANQVDQAEAYLQAIPEDLPERASAALNTGQEMWRSYVKKRQQIDQWTKESPPDGVDLEAENQAAAMFKEKAAKYLTSGVQQLSPDQMDLPKMGASISLAQLYVTSDQIDEAIALLEDAETGPLQLLKQGHPAANDEKLKPAIYKISFRAYMAAIQKSDDKGAALEKAREILESMSGQSGSDAQALVGTFVRTAAELNSKLKLASELEEKEVLAEGIALLLEQVQKASTNLDLLVWSARTVNEAGVQLKSSGSANQKSSRFFQLAESIYQTILDRGKSQAGWLKPEMRGEVLRLMGRTKRDQGLYAEAIELYGEVLKAKAGRVDVQVEAAETFQQWAAANKDPDLFAKAISGSLPQFDKRTKREKNVIWGWGRIAQATARASQFQEIFFEARFNLAKSRFEYAQLQDSQKYREMAKRDIQMTYQRYRELGGDKWKKQYERLLRTVQRSLGEAEVGFRAFESGS